jgi:hypothetical protein
MRNSVLMQEAHFKLNAYKDQLLIGSISAIGSIIDPFRHTAKVRIDVTIPASSRWACLAR